MGVRRAAQDLRRVVAVSPCLPEGETVHASGLRISDALILTVAHALIVNGTHASRARVFLAELPRLPLEAEVVWSSWGRLCRLDAAVLRLTNSAEKLQPVGRVRWGEYTMSGRYRAIGVGFPGFEARRHTECARTITGVLDTVRLSSQETLKLERTDGDFRMTAGLHQADGFSGTVLCSEDRSLAVGMITHYDPHDDRLNVTPARMLLANRDLCRAMGEDKDTPSLVSVTLEGLLVQPLPPVHTPADLLNAGRRVLPLQGSAVTTVGELKNALSGRTRVTLLHGSAHSGKTRLAWELVHLMRNEGWNAGFLARTPTATSDWRQILPHLNRDTLLVVDELETRQAQWQQLRDGVIDLAPNIKLLGIARSYNKEYRSAISVAAPNVTAVPSDITQFFEDPLRLLGIDAGGTASSARHSQGAIPPTFYTPQRIGDAQAHALASFLYFQASGSYSGEPYRVLLEHEHAYATRTLQAKLPWLQPDLCRALLTACAYSVTKTPTETIIDVRDTLQHHLCAVPGIDLRNPTLADAISLHTISETLAQLYPSLDGAHRGRLPEAVRLAQHDHAVAHHKGLIVQLQSNMSIIRMAQAEALKESAYDTPKSYAHPTAFRNTASNQPDTPATAPSTQPLHSKRQLSASSTTSPRLSRSPLRLSSQQREDAPSPLEPRRPNLPRPIPSAQRPPSPRKPPPHPQGENPGR